jgi:hypothetical protein
MKLYYIVPALLQSKHSWQKFPRFGQQTHEQVQAGAVAVFEFREIAQPVFFA